MKRYGLIGCGLSHSKSPEYFHRLFIAYGIAADFTLYDFPHIGQAIAAIQADSSVAGFTVTKPYKQSVMPYLHYISPQAQAIQAVNVVKITSQGEWQGYNTDVTGLQRSLKELSGTAPHSAIILGNGGAAQAAKYVLKQWNIPYVVANRHAAEGVISYAELTSEHIHKADMIINATPAGMYPHEEECPAIDYTALDAHHVLYDMIYNPAETRFLRYGRQQGATICNGYAMFCYQAEQALMIWNK